MAIERQELWCHDCSGYVQFDLDTALNGNHVLTCPRCGHEHCRVVQDGQITDIRWDSRNGPTIAISGSSTSWTSTSTWVSTGATNVQMYALWMNTTSTS